MTFKNFAVNYLNPYYLIQRATLIGGSLIFIFTIIAAYLGDKGSLSFIDTLLIFVGGLIVAIFFITTLKNRWFILYFVLPLLIFTISISLVNTFIFIIIGVGGAYILLWNGLRPWGDGMSINDINNKLDKYK